MSVRGIRRNIVRAKNPKQANKKLARVWEGHRIFKAEQEVKKLEHELKQVGKRKASSGLFDALKQATEYRNWLYARYKARAYSGRRA